jgi:3-isopropylmalate dehydrogenase
MTNSFKLLSLGGDGIGPEVVDCALKVIDSAASGQDVGIEVSEDLLGGAAWDAHGTFCRDDTFEAARSADAVLVGAVGGPKWDSIALPGPPEEKDGLMRLRLGLDAYFGMRPARSFASLESLLPYRDGLATGADVLVLREMTGGAFFGTPRGIDRPLDGPRVGYDNSIYDENQIARFAHAGFRIARQRRGQLVCADKANVMETYVLWREVVSEVALEYPDVAFECLYADNVSYQLARDPKRFDVILSDNLFGDMLSDQAGAIAGSLGMLPSACLSGLAEDGGRTSGIYEPVHGSAPDITGGGIANPIGTILSAAMMFEHSFARPDLARRIEAGVNAALEGGCRTMDLGGTATSAEMTDAVLQALR